MSAANDEMEDAKEDIGSEIRAMYAKLKADIVRGFIRIVIVQTIILITALFTVVEIIH